MTNDKTREQSELDEDGLWRTAITDTDQTLDLMNKLVGISDPGAVFSSPLTVGDQTVITASESYVALGLGFGTASELNIDAKGDATAEGSESPAITSQGGGGGGGGLSLRRPIAAIVIGPQGIDVQPIVDLTKIGLALITVLGSMLFLLSRMRRPLRRS